MAKMFATEAAQAIVDDAVQICGGLGVRRGHPVERLYRDRFRFDVVRLRVLGARLGCGPDSTRPAAFRAGPQIGGGPTWAALAAARRRRTPRIQTQLITPATTTTALQIMNS